uniref:Multidrug-efflux transporter n=1 Tax=Candidatus Kentrum sp. FW TaxID=2126338 RepID=A0A450TBC6_9GAMM|nr:MAG: multidrug resistance protein, MATE family [Candidatus Kentron sp. FW]
MSTGSRMSESKFPTVSELGDLLKVSLQLAFGQLGVIAIGFTDALMLGRLGPDALGAAGLALSIYNILETMGAGILFPMVVLASRARGAGRLRSIPGLIRQGLWMAGMLSVPTCVILWNLETILLMTGQIPALARMAGDFMDYFLWTAFPVFAFTVFMLAFIAMGRVGTMVVVIWLAAGLNVVLDYALIFGNLGFPAMGIAGAGLASVIVYGVGYVSVFTLLAFHRLFLKGMSVFRRAWRPNWTTLGQFPRLGWPRSLQVLMASGLFSVISLLVGRLGVQAIATHTIAFEISMVVGLGAMAIARTIASRMGIAGTQGDRAGIWRLTNGGLVLFFLFMLVPVVVLGFFPSWAVMLFVGTGQKAQALLPMATPVVALAALFILANGLRIIINHALNGLADMKIPALIAAVSYWGIALPVGVILGFVMGLGVAGLWWGLIIGMGVACVAYLTRFRWVVHNARFPARGTELP